MRQIRSRVVWRRVAVCQRGEVGRTDRMDMGVDSTGRPAPRPRRAYIFEGGKRGPSPPMGARITPQAMRAPALPEGWLV